MDVRIEILRRVGDRADSGRTYRDGELGLDTCYSDRPGDPWNVPVRTVSRYAAMDDIKRALLASHPDLEGKDWSMHYDPGGGITASWEGGGGRLSADEVAALATDHESTCLARDVVRSWHVPCDRGEWPSELGHGPAWVTLKSLTAMRNRLMAYFTSMDGEDLASRLDDLEYTGVQSGKLLPACMMALAIVADDPDLAVFVSTE